MPPLLLTIKLLIMGFFSEIGDIFTKVGNAAGNILSSTGIPIVKDIGSGLQSFFGQELAEDQLEDEQNFNAYQSQLNRDFQRDERLQTQQFNIDMWNKTNEYNSPASQIQRATAAGINPNLAVESLSRSIANPVTSSPMSGSAASSSASIASGLLMHNAQLANINAQTRKADSEANINEQEYAYNNVTFSERVNALKYANEETIARLHKIGIDTKLQEQMYEFLAHRNEEELNQLRLLCDKTTAEINNLKKQGNLLDKQGQLLDEQAQGQQLSNTLQGIQVKFSQDSGIPQGTDVGEAIWKTVVNGDAGELIDVFISNVEEVAVRNAKQFPKRLLRVVENAYDIGKTGFNVFKALGRSFFGGVTPPNSVHNP